MLERIGDPQRIPAEESTVENINQKCTLYVDYRRSQAGVVNSITISNRDESGERIIHEIGVDGDRGTISRTLVALSWALETLKSIEDEIESEMKQDMERVQRELGAPVICTPGALSKENTPERCLPEYGLNVRRSRYDAQDIFFIIKGAEKEDTAREPPFKIEVEGNGDFVSVSRKNVPPLVERLTSIARA